MAKPKAALQMYTLRFVVKEKGLETGLRQAAEAGYGAVETGNLFDDNDPEEVKRLYKELNLECAGLHTGIDALKDLEPLTGFLNEMNSPYLIISGVGDFKTRGIAAFKEAAAIFEEAGKELAAQGKMLCYHNHSWEFQDYGGVRGIDTLYGLSDPQYVKACIDTYWVRHGQDDPEKFIRRHADRLAILHMKDFRDGEFADLGEGEIDFDSVMKLGEELNVEWATVENDRPKEPAIDSIRISRKYLSEKFGI